MGPIHRREAVTDWKNWRDVFTTERVVVDLSKYRSTTLHTWAIPRTGQRHERGTMAVSSFARVSGKHPSTHLDVTLTTQAIDAIGRNTIHIDNETINIEVIVWNDGRALVVASHNRIIGSVWLAKIDASTIPQFHVLFTPPAAASVFEVRTGGKLEATFRCQSDAAGYADELRGIGASGVTIEEVISARD